eukprot:7385227-Prymnesium_polylepis.2
MRRARATARFAYARAAALGGACGATRGAWGGFGVARAPPDAGGHEVSVGFVCLATKARSEGVIDLPGSSGQPSDAGVEQRAAVRRGAGGRGRPSASRGSRESRGRESRGGPRWGRR